MFANLDTRIKKLTVMDISLTKLSVFFATIAIVKLFPQLTAFDYWALILMTVLCGAKPFHAVWIKK
ncbi:MAG: hypothetical protein AB1530_04165 [Candidatus Omnitrophota bacterium]